MGPFWYFSILVVVSALSDVERLEERFNQLEQEVEKQRILEAQVNQLKGEQRALLQHVANPEAGKNVEKPEICKHTWTSFVIHGVDIPIAQTQ